MMKATAAVGPTAPTFEEQQPAAETESCASISINMS